MPTDDAQRALILLHGGLTSIVDVADRDEVLAAGLWYPRTIRRATYAWRSLGHGRNQFLHSFLTGYPIADHINGDGLDNRRANLRSVTVAQNQWNARPRSDNKSGFKGVHLFKRTRRWRAMIKVHGKRIHLGYFATPEEAARAYDDAARQHFGQYAWLNFPALEGSGR